MPSQQFVREHRQYLVTQAAHQIARNPRSRQAAIVFPSWQPSRAIPWPAAPAEKKETRRLAASLKDPQIESGAIHTQSVDNERAYSQTSGFRLRWIEPSILPQPYHEHSTLIHGKAHLNTRYCSE